MLFALTSRRLLTQHCPLTRESHQVNQWTKTCSKPIVPWDSNMTNRQIKLSTLRLVVICNIIKAAMFWVTSTIETYSSRRPKWEEILHKCHNRYLLDPLSILKRLWIKTGMMRNKLRLKSPLRDPNIIRHNRTIYKLVQDQRYPFFRILRPVIKNSVLSALSPQTLMWALSERQMRTE